MSRGRPRTGWGTKVPLRGEKNESTGRRDRPPSINGRPLGARAYGAGILGISVALSLVWAASMIAPMIFCQSPTMPYRA
jgi:hypothetical protein